MEWSDIRIFLAVARRGTLGAAARDLGQTQPTMGRRLRALETVLGHQLFQRTQDGFVLTDEGLAVFARAERMEDEALGIHREITGSETQLEGLLRVSCSDWFGETILSPILEEFSKIQPYVTVEVLTDQRLYSLPQREADLVFRIKAFNETEVVSRRLMNIQYGVYVKKGSSHPTIDDENCRLVLMDTAFSGMPDVAWITKQLPNARIASRSNSRMMQARLCALGIGIAVLPRPLGDSIPEIELVDLGTTPPSRVTWLGYHRDMRRNGRLRALLDLVIKNLAE